MIVPILGAIKVDEAPEVDIIVQNVYALLILDLGSKWGN